MNETYRKGAVGAMMDEYERAAAEFGAALAGHSPNNSVQQLQIKN